MSRAAMGSGGGRGSGAFVPEGTEGDSFAKKLYRAKNQARVEIVLQKRNWVLMLVRVVIGWFGFVAPWERIEAVRYRPGFERIAHRMVRWTHLARKLGFSTLSDGEIIESLGNPSKGERRWPEPVREACKSLSNEGLVSDGETSAGLYRMTGHAAEFFGFGGPDAGFVLVIAPEGGSDREREDELVAFALLALMADTPEWLLERLRNANGVPIAEEPTLDVIPTVIAPN